MENIADETVHVFNANDDITLHPSKDVNHAAGNANELRLRLQVQVMEIHYTSTPLPEQRRKEGADRASHYYTHALSLSLRNSDVRESALHQFCPNQLERKGRKEFLFGSASFSRAHPASPPFIFNLLSTLVGREEAEFAIYFASLSAAVV